MRTRIRKGVQLLYGILGLSLSSSIALHPFVSYIVHSIAPRTTSIYTGENELRLKLTLQEAYESGFMFLGTMNPYETHAIKQILKRGDVFIDVGAYVDGWHSLIAAKIVGPSGHVYAFEPFPAFYKKLVRNMKLNRLSNVTAEKYAISDKKGSKDFFEDGLKSSFFTDSSPEKARKIDVPTISLGEYISLKKLKNVKLVKIDVEGAEMNVLRGMDTLLSRKDSPDLMLECIDQFLKRAGESRTKLLSYLSKHGYYAFTFTAGGLTRYSKNSTQETFNLYFSKSKNPITNGDTKSIHE